MDETGPGFCPLTDFGISGIELQVLPPVTYVVMYFIYLVVWLLIS